MYKYSRSLERILLARVDFETKYSENYLIN